MHFTVYILWIMLVFLILSLFQLFPSENINSHFSITSMRWSLQPKQISLLNRVCVCVCWAVNQSRKGNSSLWTGVCSSARVHSAFLLFCLTEGKLFLVMEFEKRSTRHMTTETWTLLLFLTAASVQCCFIIITHDATLRVRAVIINFMRTADVFWKALQMDSNSSFGPSFTSHFEVFLNSFAKHLCIWDFLLSFMTLYNQVSVVNIS